MQFALTYSIKEGQVFTAPMAYCGHIKYRILWHNKCVNSSTPPT